jgi:hypothetical protein
VSLKISDLFFEEGLLNHWGKEISNVLPIGMLAQKYTSRSIKAP